MADHEEDALERARRLLNQADAPKDKSPAAPRRGALGETVDTVREFNENVGWLRRMGHKVAAFFRNLWGVLQYMWKHSGPVRRLIGPIARWIGKHYMRFFNAMAYKTNKETGARTFSKRGTTFAILLTALMLVAVWYGMRPVFITAKQAAMALTEQEAYTYFHGSETIEEGKLYSIKTTQGIPATPEITVHMQVETDLIYWIWFPEDIANAVPNEAAWGRVVYTGFRFKLFGWFPEVKDVEAIPLSELPEDHPAKSGKYYISNAELKRARKEGRELPGTDLERLLGHRQ